MNELELTLGWVAKTVGGTLQSGDPALPVGDVLTDSRSLRTGDVFVALKGPRFDGHSFVEEVLERGAAGAIVEAAGSEEQDPAYPVRYHVCDALSRCVSTEASAPIQLRRPRPLLPDLLHLPTPEDLYR